MARHEISLVEVDSSVLEEIEPTGSFTNPFWRPDPSGRFSLPPPPRLPSLPSLPPPPAALMRALPPPPVLPRLGSTLPPRYAHSEDETRPEVHPGRSPWDSSSPSLGPAAWSLAAPTRRALLRKPFARATGIGVLAGIALFASAWLVASPSPATAQARGLVTVADSEGVALGSVSVLVDGLPSCDATPCSVALEPGAHRIEVVDLLTGQRAGRSISVARHERANLHFALQTETATRLAASPPPAVAPAADEPIAVTSLPEEQTPRAPAEAPRLPSPVMVPRAAAGALLNLNSIPISNVLLDGRPVGSTPLTGVQVSPGTHSVTFAHPELGRRGASIEIGAGEKKAVVVRFRKPDRADAE